MDLRKVSPPMPRHRLSLCQINSTAMLSQLARTSPHRSVKTKTASRKAVALCIASCHGELFLCPSRSLPKRSAQIQRVMEGFSESYQPIKSPFAYQSLLIAHKILCSSSRLMGMAVVVEVGSRQCCCRPLSAAWPCRLWRQGPLTALARGQALWGDPPPRD